MRNHRCLGDKRQRGKEAAASPCELDHRCTCCVPPMNLHGRGIAADRTLPGLFSLQHGALVEVVGEAGQAT
jgi:hypothetical protein